MKRIRKKMKKIIIDVSKLSKNNDNPFMKECAKIDANQPATWARYTHDTKGALDIITMEYNELKKAHDTNNAKDYEENLYHLATACLNAWRIEHHDE